MMRKKAAMIGIGVGMLATAPALALTQPSTDIDQQRIIETLSFGDILPVLQRYGVNYQVGDMGGRPVAKAYMGGTEVTLVPNVCTADHRCAGLSLYAFSPMAGTTAVMTDFNRTTPVARVTPGPDGGAMLYHYVIGDHGVTQGSLMVNLRAFASSTQKWESVAGRGSSRVVSFTPLVRDGPPVSEGKEDTHLKEATAIAAPADPTDRHLVTLSPGQTSTDSARGNALMIKQIAFEPTHSPKER